MGNNTLDSQLLEMIKANDSVIVKNKFRRELNAYIDRNNEVLSASIPAHRLLFNDSQREKIFDIWKIDKKIVNDAKLTIDSDKAVRKPIMYNMVSTPHNYLVVELIKYYEMKKDNEAVKALVLHLIFHFYSIIHPKYFKFLPNPDIMEFTINRISNKFLFKQYGVLLKVLSHMGEVNHDAMKSTLLKNGDTGALDYLVSMNSRLNGLMQTFSKEYYLDYEQKNAIFNQSDNYDNDNFILTTNLSGIIENKARNASVDFFTTRISEKDAHLAAKASQADVNVLIDAITNVKNNKSSEISELMKNILITYLSDPENTEASLGTMVFVGRCIKIYSKSNTKQKSILEIKRILDTLLESNSKHYQETNREATKINYRKALYYYIILIMQKSVKA